MTGCQLKPGWKMLKFGDIAQNVAVRVDPVDAKTDVYVGLEHLDPSTIHLRQWGHPSDVTGQKLVFKKGDVIFGRRRAYQRKLAVAEFDGICSAHAMVVRAKPKMILPEFLPFFLQSDMFMERAIEISVGSLSPTINWKTLKVEEFPLPPLDEQKRIAEILWAADKAVESWLAAFNAFESTKQQILSSTFTPEKTSLNGWRIKKLKEVATLQTGIAKGRKYAPGETLVEFPYLRVANVKDGYLDLIEMKTISVTLAEVERFSVRQGDVLITEGGDFDKVGRGTVWNGEIEDCLHQNHVFCVRTQNGVLLPEYLSFQTASPYGKVYFLKCAKKTSNLASINSTQVKNFPVLLTSIDEQEKLIVRIKFVEEKQAQIRQQIEKIKSISTGYFASLVNGGAAHV